MRRDNLLQPDLADGAAADRVFARSRVADQFACAAPRCYISLSIHYQTIMSLPTQSRNPQRAPDFDARCPVLV